jgi:hypothetical protein
MHRLRSSWFALIGGLLLVGLSVSSVFAARPAGTEDGTRGQQIAAFVHELVFGSTDEEEQAPEEEQLEEEEQQEEQEEDTESEEDTPEDVEDSDADASAHGQCVSEEAADKSDEEYDADFRNHGAYVSEAARVTCWQTDEEAPVEDAILDSGAEFTPPDTDSADVSEREQRRADREAAKAERKAAKSTNGHGGGNGHGRGGGRP